MLTTSQARDHCRLTICWLVEFDNLMMREAFLLPIFLQGGQSKASMLVSVVMLVMVVLVKVGKAPGKYLQ